MTANKLLLQGQGLSTVILKRARPWNWTGMCARRAALPPPTARVASWPSFATRPGRARGDVLVAEDGSLIRVLAAPQKVLHITACAEHGTPFDLMRAAYHLGNRHVPIELQPDHLKIEPDHVLADMLRSMHMTVVEADLPFEPEGGAYGGHVTNDGHSHHHHGHGHCMTTPTEPMAWRAELSAADVAGLAGAAHRRFSYSKGLKRPSMRLVTTETEAATGWCSSCTDPVARRHGRDCAATPPGKSAICRATLPPQPVGAHHARNQRAAAADRADGPLADRMAAQPLCRRSCAHAPATGWPSKMPATPSRRLLPTAPAPRPAMRCWLCLWLGRNMVQAAIKAVPLGQSAGQRILARLTTIPQAVEYALALPDHARQAFAHAGHSFSPA
jgi:urease accessory protein